MEDVVAPLASNVCIMHHAALACMCQTVCDLTSSNVLGRLVQCEQKGWDKGRCIGIYTKRVKAAWLSLSLAVKVPQ